MSTLPKLASARSFLFAPGSEERKLRNALRSGADAVIADLEDGVAPQEKASARALVPRVLAEEESDALRLVRVNAAGSGLLAKDLAALAGTFVDALVLPKATPEAVEELGPDGPPLVALVETATGLRLSYELASQPRVEALMLGALDLGVELGLEARPDGMEVLFARSKLVLDSAAAGIRGPIDQVRVDLRDAEGLEAETRLARSLGFRGKACIHPAQVDVVNAIFAPSEGELEHARRIVAVYEQTLAEGRGAVALDGELVDLPVVERARQMLTQARGERP